MVQWTGPRGAIKKSALMCPVPRASNCVILSRQLSLSGSFKWEVERGGEGQQRGRKAG